MTPLEDVLRETYRVMSRFPAAASPHHLRLIPIAQTSDIAGRRLDGNVSQKYTSE